MKDILLTTTPTSTIQFSDLGLNPHLLQALTSEGYTTPTPIQAQAIPGVMSGRDLMGIAQTGTGKTAAFALPILDRLAADKKPALRNGTRALILSPTRELATQIADSFRTYGKHTGLTVAVMFGGMPFGPQVNAMRNGVDVLVATPGRLLDHVEQRTVNLAGTEIVVLDEADQMLDMGFIAPIRKILSKLSQRRQSLFFSATMPREIGALAAEMLKDPLRVQVTPVAKTADRVTQSVIHVEPQKKASLLVELFADPAMKRTLVFTRTKRGADKVARHLEAAGIMVAAIHGNKSQRQREAALHQFKNGRIRGLIATDIAARGIDIDDVTHVVNFELPNIPESYVHRIGRTARAGAEGIAISLCAGDERAFLRDIERTTRQTIPASDRTNDAGLAASGAASAARARPRSGNSDGDRNSGGGRSNGHTSQAGKRPHKVATHKPRGPQGPRDAEARNGEGRRSQPGRSHEGRSHESRSHDARGHEGRGHDARGGNEPRRRDARGADNQARSDATAFRGLPRSIGSR